MVGCTGEVRIALRSQLFIRDPQKSEDGISTTLKHLKVYDAPLSGSAAGRTTEIVSPATIRVLEAS